MDLIIRNAKLRHTEGLRDIGIAGGKIVEIAAKVRALGRRSSTPKGD